MFCTNCGTKLPEDVNYCIQCGYPVEKTTERQEKVDDQKVVDKALGLAEKVEEVFLDKVLPKVKKTSKEVVATSKEVGGNVAHVIREDIAPKVKSTYEEMKEKEKQRQEEAHRAAEERIEAYRREVAAKEAAGDDSYKPYLQRAEHDPLKEGLWGNDVSFLRNVYWALPMFVVFIVLFFMKMASFGLLKNSLLLFLGVTIFVYFSVAIEFACHSSSFTSALVESGLVKYVGESTPYPEKKILYIILLKQIVWLMAIFFLFVGAVVFLNTHWISVSFVKKYWSILYSIIHILIIPQIVKDAIAPIPHYAAIKEAFARSYRNNFALTRVILVLIIAAINYFLGSFLLGGLLRGF